MRHTFLTNTRCLPLDFSIFLKVMIDTFIDSLVSLEYTNCHGANINVKQTIPHTMTCQKKPESGTPIALLVKRLEKFSTFRKLLKFHTCLRILHYDTTLVVCLCALFATPVSLLLPIYLSVIESFFKLCRQSTWNSIGIVLLWMSNFFSKPICPVFIVSQFLPILKVGASIVRHFATFPCCFGENIKWRHLFKWAFA